MLPLKPKHIKPERLTEEKYTFLGHYCSFRNLSIMTIKGLHEFIRQERLANTQVIIPQYFQQQNVDVLVIDFCAEFFEILKQSIAIPVFRDYLRGNMDVENDMNTVNAHVLVFVNIVMERLHTLYHQCDNIRIILVIDGERLYAKNETHKARNSLRRDAFNQVIRRGPERLSDHALRRYAYRWITFSQGIKEALVHTLGNYPALKPDYQIPVQEFNVANTQIGPGIYYYMAQYEADPVVVHIAKQVVGDSKAIISRDGDLFAYHEGDQPIMVCSIGEDT